MTERRMPGFTAEAALPATGGRYDEFARISGPDPSRGSTGRARRPSRIQGGITPQLAISTAPGGIRGLGLGVGLGLVRVRVRVLGF